jgi:hypothetical protein
LPPYESDFFRFANPQNDGSMHFAKLVLHGGLSSGRPAALNSLVLGIRDTLLELRQRNTL